MKPQKIKRDPQLGLFKIALHRIINFEHPLVKLAKQIDWNAFDQEFEAHFTDDGRPAIATRLMVSLHYLKYRHNLSDEETVLRWVENPYWQHLSGRQHFEHKAKGKAQQRYAFGCKVGFSVTAKGNWIGGAKAFNGNPYDGHTLKESLEQTERSTNIKIQQATCEQGYRGHGVEGINVLIVPRRKNKASKAIRHWWRRRNALEPIIGHNKSDHRLNRNRLAGQFGDQLNALLSACGFNIKKLIRAFWLWFQNVINNMATVNFQRTFA